ncbi:TetR/AcrR family transcriptional regulator [Nocardia sp. CDC159]|uniref:TetR/AcrR family transcriptional regulator n=1 Tax=Nocardia pulmonis TaxID=2951408 RepID=A0A9X2E6L1_9NOCA|nr:MULTISPECIES: TetR/AcrR family transcriptional regulator [Nocardia]MCM6772453.1 TetR/AcrR family transcriptional regulator [Nocardia pulmonis]MCM6784889.1 TetR/AcrR family transcriptional regulator [Nocardia sp. CDC159]
MTRPGTPLPKLLRRAAGRALGGVRPDPSDTDAAILDAAVAVLARRGTRAATMTEVAAAAGVGRATLFRRFAGKDELFEAALTREITALLDALAARLATIDDPAEQVAAGFALCLTLHRHPLLAAETPHRGDLLAALTHGDPAPIALAHARVRAHIAHAQSTHRLPPGDPDAQADALIHVTLGYLLTPSLAVDLGEPADVDHLARVAIAPILTGPPSR